MRRSAGVLVGVVAIVGALSPPRAFGQQNSRVDGTVNVTLRAPGLGHAAPAVVWLSALAGTPALPFTPHGGYTLVQKNRAFEPHLQVVPAGAVVQFPNEDPFFHNVFSLFDGKRFDLGLYEAGSSRAVTFPRDGVSYIFCNIHPEMSAVIVTLSTPLYAKGKTGALVTIRGVPPGEYDLRVWAEGLQPASLDGLRRRLHVEPGDVEHIEIVANASAARPEHKDKFGKDYVTETPPY